MVPKPKRKGKSKSRKNKLPTPEALVEDALRGIRNYVAEQGVEYVEQLVKELKENFKIRGKKPKKNM